MANMVLRAFTNRKKDFMTSIYKTYVRPQLEYGTVIWNPSALGLIRTIERPQRYYTRRICAPNMPYSKRLEELELDSLEERRIRTDLVTVYKSKNGLNHTQFAELFKLAPVGCLRSKNSAKLFKPYCQ